MNPTNNHHDEDFMQMALQQANLAFALGEIPIGAILVKDGKVLAANHNRRELDQDPTAHAEIVVIQEAARQLGTWRLLDTTLYVTLEPCAMCAGAIIQARIPRFVFGAFDPKAGACGSLFNLVMEPKLNHHPAILGGVLEQPCGEILQRFFQQRRKNHPAFVG